MTTRQITDPRLDECAAAVFSDRDKIVAFYDVRYVFAAYSEALGSLAAAMLKNEIYSREVMEQLLEDVKQDALTRKSNSRCQRTIGTDVIRGGKQ